ncbi:MAG: ROK family transcriptional regulator [Propionibacteriaceae bacterium]
MTLEETQLPTLDLLRQLTDTHVVDQLLLNPELTRAEISARTGISKPTISESVRRLEAAGLLTESGQQQGRRGRAGTFYRLRDDAGVALAMSAGPDGMIVETCDLRGTVVDRIEREVPSPADSATLNPIMSETVTEAVTQARGPIRAWALSLAGPVDQVSGRLVQLPNSPFLLDELRPRELIGSLASPLLQVDNDVNWAALAEHHQGNARDLVHFCYCYLGPGLGTALVSSGVVVHGDRGLAGELAHVRTTGPGGRSLRLVECFDAWDLLHPGSNAIDVARLVDLLESPLAAHRRVRDEVVQAVAGAICSITALFNPEGVIIGGPWSGATGFEHELAERVHSEAAIDTEVRLSALDAGAPLAGARLQAVRSAQSALLPRS